MEALLVTAEGNLRWRLEEHGRRLSRLRRRLAALGRDYEHRASGGRIHYAVDWSELRSLLTGKVDDLEVGLEADSEERERRVRLGLSHLFNTLTDMLYLLPPHAGEMWSFVRDERLRRLRAYEHLHDRARGAIETLSADNQRLLESLSTGADSISQDALDRLIELVKGDFEELCDRVTTFEDSLDRNVLSRLNRQLKHGKLSYSVDLLLEQLQLSPAVMEVSPAEVEAVARAIPRDKSWANRSDARALLQLRGINRHLSQSGSCMVLVTRDQKIRDAAGLLAQKSSFNWPEARKHFRHVETIYLDLALRGSSFEEARTWIAELDDRFGKLERSVRDLLAQDTTTDASAFVAEGSRVLAEAKRIWHEHVNLRMSLAEENVPWLSAEARRPAAAGKAAGEDKTRREVALIRQLWAFARTDRYRELARKNADETWLELHDEAIRMVLLSHIGKEGTMSVARALAGRTEGDQTVLQSLRSTNYSFVCSLQFVSATYQRLLGELRRWEAPDERRRKKISEAFLEVVRAAMDPDRREAEGFLFMAFLLGVLNLWSEARVLAERSLTLTGEKRVSEIEYFLAVASRRLASAEEPPKIAELVVAYEHIMQAIAKKRSETGQDGHQDPRYLKERGTIILEYYETTARQKDAAPLEIPSDGEDHPSRMTEERGTEMLRQALGYIKDDRSLRVDVLNNLAWEALRQGDIDSADRYLAKLDVEFEQARTQSDPWLPHVPWPSVRDTQVFHAAHRARQRGDAVALRRCAQELRAIAGEDDLLQGEKEFIESHADQVDTWLSELSTGQ